MSQPSWTISLGADSAGVDYKTILKADLEKDPRVKKVIDVGVTKDGKDIDRAYPHVGIAAAEKVMNGEADRALLVCGTGRSLLCDITVRTASDVSKVWESLCLHVK